MAFQLPALPYPTNALEPYIDEQTMEIHHGKHHAAYVNNLNAALERHPSWQSKPIEELLARPRQRARGHPHRRPQQRRRPRQPLPVLGDHEPERRRRARPATWPRRSTRPSAASTNFKEEFAKAGAAGSAPAGPGWC